MNGLAGARILDGASVGRGGAGCDLRRFPCWSAPHGRTGLLHTHSAVDSRLFGAIEADVRIHVVSRLFAGRPALLLLPVVCALCGFLLRFFRHAIIARVASHALCSSMQG